MTKKQYSIEDRKNIALVKMALVKAAHVNIKNIFPTLVSKSPNIHHTKNGSHTKKGSGRKHLQGKQS
jgi:hypothetical protein